MRISSTNARRIHGTPIADTVPTSGDALTFAGGQWAPIAPSGGPPLPHASTHEVGGGDGVTITHAQTTGQGSDDHHAQDHAVSHNDGGADPVSGDALGIVYTPANYSPSGDILAGHLAGLDAALAAGHTGSRIYSPSATDPSSPAPTDGDLYYNTELNMWMYYDGDRSKWLSVESKKIEFISGSGQNTGSGSYFRFYGIGMTASVGEWFARNATIIGFEYRKVDTNNVSLDFRRDGVSHLTVNTSTNQSGSDFTLNTDFNSGAVLSGYNAGPQTLTGGYSMTMYVKWRL